MQIIRAGKARRSCRSVAAQTELPPSRCPDGVAAQSLPRRKHWRGPLKGRSFAPGSGGLEPSPHHPHHRRPDGQH
eukprot:352963-Chlamydomonas_euryale.AAC.2